MVRIPDKCVDVGLKHSERQTHPGLTQRRACAQLQALGSFPSAQREKGFKIVTFFKNYMFSKKLFVHLLLNRAFYGVF